MKEIIQFRGFKYIVYLNTKIRYNVSDKKNNIYTGFYCSVVQYSPYDDWYNDNTVRLIGLKDKFKISYFL